MAHRSLTAQLRRGFPLSAPLISASELSHALTTDRDRPAILDVRWTLGGPPGLQDYLAGHIPGAHFLDLDRDLAAPPGSSGRHPLPSPGSFTLAMRRAGVSAQRPAVVYDAASSLSAARAWWLLRYFGHPQVFVLDGGLRAWTGAGHSVQSGRGPEPARGDFAARPGAMPMLDAQGAARLVGQGILLDARASERYTGRHEPVDPVAGHIPGAVNFPTTENLDESGRFLTGGELRAQFRQAGLTPGSEVGAYCGSGVTAAHEVLALELAGFPASLYVGSWSEWITDPRRPVASGPEPG